PPALAPRPARVLLLATVLVVAVCGFVYELQIVALGTYLFGNSVFQVSIVLAAFVSAMGLGSLAAKPLLRRPVAAFALVEAAVALVGGLSAMALYAAFAWADLYQPAMIVTASAIGLLVGCEIPLLLSLMQRVRPRDAGVSVADLLAADYLGAVVAGIGFPFVLLPLLGQIQGAIAVGALNALAGLAVVWLMGGRARARLAAAPLAVLALLAAGAAASGRFEVTARQRLFDDPIVHAERSRYQEIVLTERLGGGDLRLFLNGDLQFSSADEHRYHEALVHPAMAGPHARVLVLGGGDGLAMREVLRYPGVERAVEVELDPAMIALARRDPRLARLNRGALRDRRVEVVTADAFAWLRRQSERFDVIVADFPDPDDAATAKLYSVEMYAGLRRRALAPGGRIVVQAGSPFFAREAFWGVERSVAAAGLATRPYHVDVPSFGDWGFVLAAAGSGGTPGLALRPPAGARLRFLTAAVLAGAAAFPADAGPLKVAPNTLNRPRLLDYERRAYRDY
ncbi:MAG TPA: polyamine aminopropyltransferase, partial [Solirubrobacteraceae bacterium]